MEKVRNTQKHKNTANDPPLRPFLTILLFAIFYVVWMNIQCIKTFLNFLIYFISDDIYQSKNNKGISFISNVSICNIFFNVVILLAFIHAIE